MRVTLLFELGPITATLKEDNWLYVELGGRQWTLWPNGSPFTLLKAG